MRRVETADSNKVLLVNGRHMKEAFSRGLNIRSSGDSTLKLEGAREGRIIGTILV